MDDTDRSRYSRHECASLFGTVVWLENILMAVVVRYLSGLAPDHPYHRYLLVEIADECRHSMMFGEYVRRAGTPAYRPSARLRTEGALFVRGQGVVSSFIAILAAEELVDVSNRAAMSNPRHWQRVARDLGSLTSLLTDVGVITALTRPAWQALGLIGDRSDTHVADRSADRSPALRTA